MYSRWALSFLTFVLPILLLRGEDTCSAGEDECDTNETNVVINESCANAEDDCSKPKPINKKKSLFIYKDLNATLERIRESCGQVCDLNVEGSPGKFYDVIKKDVDCKALFENEDIDKSSEFDTPPMRLPKYLISEFTYNGRVELRTDYWDDSEGANHWLKWPEEMITELRQMFRVNRLSGSYGLKSVKNIYRHLTEHMNIVGKHVLVVGSQRPWLEVIILEAGAAKVTTLDYAQITSEHPQIDAITPLQMRQGYLDGTFKEAFDAMVSYSSLEHSGLGRYGDALNPWGDVIAMARSHCLLKPGGQALVGVPTGPKDILLFNAARVYGPIMYAHLFANWKQVYTEMTPEDFSTGCPWCYQPLYIVEKE